MSFVSEGEFQDEANASISAIRSPAQAIQAGQLKRTVVLVGLKYGLRLSYLHDVAEVLENNGFHSRKSLSNLTDEVVARLEIPREMAVALRDEANGPPAWMKSGPLPKPPLIDHNISLGQGTSNAFSKGYLSYEASAPSDLSKPQLVGECAGFPGHLRDFRPASPPSPQWTKAKSFSSKPKTCTPKSDSSASASPSRKIADSPRSELRLGASMRDLRPHSSRSSTPTREELSPRALWTKANSFPANHAHCIRKSDSGSSASSSKIIQDSACSEITPGLSASRLELQSTRSSTPIRGEPSPKAVCANASSYLAKQKYLTRRCDSSSSASSSKPAQGNSFFEISPVSKVKLRSTRSSTPLRGARPVRSESPCERIACQVRRQRSLDMRTPRVAVPLAQRRTIAGFGRPKCSKEMPAEAYREPSCDTPRRRARAAAPDWMASLKPSGAESICGPASTTRTKEWSAHRRVVVPASSSSRSNVVSQLGVPASTDVVSTVEDQPALLTESSQQFARTPSEQVLLYLHRKRRATMATERCVGDVRAVTLPVDAQISRRSTPQALTLSTENFEVDSLRAENNRLLDRVRKLEQGLTATYCKSVGL